MVRHRRPSMKTTRIAIIGFGRWGRYCHAALIRNTPNLELIGIASSNPEKRTQIESELGVKAYDSLEEVLADATVDAIVLATPNDTHFDYTMRALEAGKHVVTDKPMCLTLSECDAMIERANQSGKLLTTFQNRRLDGDYLTLKSLLAEGELGELRWLEMAWGGFGPWGGWRGTLQHGGGKFLDLGAHLVDQMLTLIPSPVTGIYLRLHHDYPQSEVESEAFLVMEFQNGATAVCDTSSMAAIDKPRFYARGTKATFQKFGLDPQENALMKGDITTAKEDPVTFGHLKGPQVDRTVPTLAGNWAGFYENFAQAAAGETTLLAPPEQTRRVMAVFEAAKQSATQRQVIQTSI
ncbi:Gfo/Idh/MocA family oxidoreductase [bacterium]|nr:MAG: Gfo/Idh/MocA family oxidoreductase [bacterium]